MNRHSGVLFSGLGTCGSKYLASILDPRERKTGSSRSLSEMQKIFTNGNRRRIDDRYRLRRIKDRVGRIPTRGRLTRRVTQTDFVRTLRLGL